MSFPPESAVVATLRSAGCVFAEDEARLLLATAASPAELGTLLERRVAGEPLEYVLGWAEFGGLRIAVEPGVFVPRRRTEFLVDRAAALARPGAVVVDLCCGSGALGVALAAARPGVELYAADIEPTAVRCARRNVVPAGGQVFEGDLYDALPPPLRGRVDVLLANVPYVPTAEIATMPPEARDHEPRVALDGGDDGLAVLRRISAGATTWLAPGGHVLVESSERQASRAAAIFTRDGLDARIATSADISATVVIGTNDVTSRRRGGRRGR
jgi:release factor glutamine methyltransferase